MKEVARTETAMTPAEMMIRGEALFRARRIEIVSVDNLRGQIKRFDETAADVESQASDRRKKLVQRRGDAEVRLVGAELAIKYFIVEAAEIIKTERGETSINTDLIDTLWQVLYSDVDNNIPDTLQQRARAVLAEAKEAIEKRDCISCEKRIAEAAADAEIAADEYWKAAPVLYLNDE
jgi:hypothetical protein